MQASSPLVDVIMPVRNGMPYIQEAVQGLQAQTLSAFRVLVLDHASSDGTADYIRAVAALDARFEYRWCGDIQGLSNLRNEGLALCNAPFIAMHDADDVSHPERFARCVARMQADPDMAVLGTCSDVINEHGHIFSSLDMPCDAEGLWPYFFFFNPISQPTVMISRAWLQRFGARYGTDFVQLLPEDRQIRVPHVAEDYFFFAQFALVAKVVNMPDRLLKYRWYANNTSSKNYLIMTEVSIMISRFLADCHAATSGCAQFDPALFANHGHRLVRFLDRGPDFRKDFDRLYAALAPKGGRYEGFSREMALRRVYAHRGAAHMLLRLLHFATRYGAKREEYYPVLSYLMDGRKGLEPPSTQDGGRTLSFRRQKPPEAS